MHIGSDPRRSRTIGTDLHAACPVLISRMEQPLGRSAGDLKTLAGRELRENGGGVGSFSSACLLCRQDSARPLAQSIMCDCGRAVPAERLGSGNALSSIWKLVSVVSRAYRSSGGGRACSRREARNRMRSGSDLPDLLLGANRRRPQRGRTIRPFCSDCHGTDRWARKHDRLVPAPTRRDQTARSLRSFGPIHPAGRPVRRFPS